MNDAPNNNKVVKNENCIIFIIKSRSFIDYLARIFTKLISCFFLFLHGAQEMSTQLFFVKQCNAMWLTESAKGISESKRA